MSREKLEGIIEQTRYDERLKTRANMIEQHNLPMENGLEGMMMIPLSQKEAVSKILSSGYVHIDEHAAKIIIQVEYNKLTGEELPEDVALGMVQAIISTCNERSKKMVFIEDVLRCFDDVEDNYDGQEDVFSCIRQALENLGGGE